MAINITSKLGNVVTTAAQSLKHVAGLQHTISATQIQSTAKAMVNHSGPMINIKGLNKNLLASASSAISSLTSMQSMLSQVTSTFSSLTSMTSQLSSITGTLSSMTSLASGFGSITSLVGGLSGFSSLAGSLSSLMDSSGGSGSVSALQNTQISAAGGVDALAGAVQVHSNLAATSVLTSVSANLTNLSNVTKAPVITSSTTAMTLVGTGWASSQVISFETIDPSLSGNTHITTYTIVSGDIVAGNVPATITNIAGHLASKINADTTVNTFLNATASAALITLVSTSGNMTSYLGSSSGGSETFNTGPALNALSFSFSQAMSNSNDDISTIIELLNSVSVLVSIGEKWCDPSNLFPPTVTQVQNLMQDIYNILNGITLANALTDLGTKSSSMEALIASLSTDVTAVSTALAAL